jgi:hypothetical protein
VTLFAVGAGLASEGCDSLSLSNGAYGSAAPGFFASSDAATDASVAANGGGSNTSGGTGAFPAPDAGTVAIPAGDDAGGAASPSSGNQLCHYGYADGGMHVCQPDTSAQCASSVDAGAYTGWDDAGEDGGAPLSACHVVGVGQACMAAGPGGDGIQCQTSSDCADSFECVGSPGQCRHYCCGGNDTCNDATAVTTGPTFCDVEPMSAGDTLVPVCVPVTTCTPLLGGTGPGTCPSNETCAVVKDDGTTSCVAVGPVAVDGDCSTEHCQAGLTCLGSTGNRKCFELCEVDSTVCEKGKTCMSSAQLFSDPNVGICQ